METLFGCNSTNLVPREPIRRSVLPPVERENRVLNPKKSQNIAILLRALSVTRDEVSEALLDGKSYLHFLSVVIRFLDLRYAGNFSASSFSLVKEL